MPPRDGERLTSTPFVPLASRPPAAPASSSDGAAGFDWRAPLAAVWALVAGVLLARLGIANHRLRQLAAAAEPVPDAVAAEVDRLASALRLRRAPAVRVSDDIEIPQVFGLFRPTVLLPAAALDTLTPRERAMTLCHELAHVRRRDLAFAWAPAIMERLLFFHPGARLAAREYAFAREAACDADVLQHLGEAPRDYGRLLLRLGVTRQPTAIAAAQSSPSTRLLRRRLAMLNEHEPSPRSGRGIWLAGALLLPLAVPLSLVAREVETFLPPASALRAAADVATDDQAPPPPPPAPPAPRSEAPPPPPPPPPPPDGYGYWVSSEGGQTIMLFDGNSTIMFSGSSEDAREARRLRGASGEPFLYVRSKGTTYVSRDRALIERVRREFREQHELGAQQGQLGALQGELGARQGALGAHQAALAGRHAAEAGALAAVGHDTGSHGRIEALHAALAALHSDHGEARAELEAARKALRQAIAALETSGSRVSASAAERAASARADAAAMQAEVAAEQHALGQRQAEARAAPGGARPPAARGRRCGASAGPEDPGRGEGVRADAARQVTTPGPRRRGPGRRSR